MASLPTFLMLNIEIKIPIKHEVSIGTNGAQLEIIAEVKKQQRFIRKVAALCVKYGYAATIEERQIAPPRGGSIVEKRNCNNTEV